MNYNISNLIFDDMKNVFQFKKGFINLPTNGKVTNKELALTVNSELMQFGFCLDEKAIEMLSKANMYDINVFKNEVIEYLIDITGSKHSYKPFWPGFPKQVMEMSEAELWYNQILHYISNGKFLPDDLTKKRKKAFENPEPTIITAGTEEDFLKIFTDLLSVNQSLTDSDLTIVDWFIGSGQKLIFPSVIPFKETLILVIVDLIQSGRIDELNVPKLTTTDVLRIAVGMSDGNISLPAIPPKKVKESPWTTKLVDNPLREDFKFKKFKRAERRLILELLENTDCNIQEMATRSNRWVRLGEILHPGEYKKRFPKSFKAFQKLRNERPKTWEAFVESKFKESFESGLTELSKRPGSFLRKLDALIRKNPDKLDLIYDKVRTSGVGSSNKVLFELYNYFSKRDKEQTYRKIMLKGGRKQIDLPLLEKLDTKIVDNVSKSIIDSLYSKFTTLSPMGKTWIDPELKKIPLPSNMRSLNETLKPTVRGQRIPFSNPDAKVIRSFVHWYDEKGNEDLDLTAIMLSEDGTKKVHMGWNGDHNSEYGCYSGDVRLRVGACAEYIDINVKKSVKEGYRYVLLTVCNYNGRSLESVKDCVFGYMEREKPKRGDIHFKPSIVNTSRLRSESRNTLIAILDLKEMEYVMVDVDFDGIPVMSHNDNLLDIIQPFMEEPKFSVYHLLELHAKSRGKLVEDKEEAESVLSNEMFNQNYVNILKYMGI